MSVTFFTQQHSTPNRRLVCLLFTFFAHTIRKWDFVVLVFQSMHTARIPNCSVLPFDSIIGRAHVSSLDNLHRTRIRFFASNFNRKPFKTFFFEIHLHVNDPIEKVNSDWFSRKNKNNIQNTNNCYLTKCV